MLQMGTIRSVQTVPSVSPGMDQRISIAGFEKLVRQTGFVVVDRIHFLFNPIYRFKFGIRPRCQVAVIRSIPFFRDFLTTACYYLVKPTPATEAE